MYCIVKYSEVDKKECEVKEKDKEKEKEKQKEKERERGKEKEKERGKVKEKASKQIEESKLSVEKSASQKSDEKTEIRYEDEVKELLINPNCLTRILLDYVSEKLSVEKDAEIDFCDEFGRMTKIGSLKNWEYATEVLKPQSTYVVIAFQRTRGGKWKSIRPVLTKNCKLFGEIVTHLRTQFSSSSIYISDWSSRKSFGGTRAGSRGSLKSSDKYRIGGSEYSKSSDRLRKSMRKGSQGSYVQFGRKNSSRNTIRSIRSVRSGSKSAQVILGMDSEVEIKPKRLQSKESKDKAGPKEKKPAKKSPK